MYDRGYLHRILRILRQVYPVTNKPKFSLHFQFFRYFISLSVNWTTAQNTILSDSLFSLETKGKANSRVRENLPRTFYAFPCTLLICPPPPQILHNLCFTFLLGITAVPREIENNAYAKFWGVNKVH